MLNQHSEQAMILQVMESQHSILKDLDHDPFFDDHSIEFRVLCLCRRLTPQGCRQVLKDILGYHLEMTFLRRLGIPQGICTLEFEGRLVQHLQKLEGVGDEQLILREVYQQLLIRRGRLLNLSEDGVCLLVILVDGILSVVFFSPA
jgi:hypothetical protein